MGTTLLVVAVPLLATSALLLLSVATPVKTALIQASPEFTELRSCDGQPCLISLLRQKRQDASADPPAESSPGDAPVPDTPAAETTTAAPPSEGDGDAVQAPANPGSSGGGPPGGNLGEIPLPPVTQQMPNLPPNFPYPDVKVVQEVPTPTKPRKKLISGGGANPYPFPPIGPPMDPVPPPMEVPTEPMEVPTEPIEVPTEPMEPAVPAVAPIEPTDPVEKEPYPTPIKTNCKPGGGYGPPQDWRFPKARGHKKCPPSAQTNYAAGNEYNYAAGNGANYATGNENYATGANYAAGHGANYAAGNGANYAAGNGANYAAGNGVNYAAGNGANYAAGNGANYAAGNGANYVTGKENYAAGSNYAAGNGANYATGNEAAPEDGSIHMRTAQRDDEAGHPTTVHPHGTGSATSVVCSMGTVVFAVVAYFLNVAI